MSTALVSAFYDVDDVLLQNRINSNMTRSSMMNMDSPRKITGMTNNFIQHHQHIPQQSHHQQQHQQISQQNQQFRSRTGSISSTSSVQSDNSGYSFNGSSMSMGSPSSTSSVISSLGGSMPSSPVDYRKQLDRSVSEVGTDSSRMRDRQDQANRAASQTNINSSRYKTELCRPFEENGYCKYGDKCQFAHGSQELRSLNRHPKYKTELCRTYHTIGFCPYGPRCHFVHNDEERRLAQQNQQQQAALQSLKQQMGTQPPQHQNTTASSSHPQPQFSAGQPSHMLPQHHHVAAPTTQQQPPHHHHASMQQHHLRPKSLNFNLLQMQRDSLGSTADSPPSSVTDSPTMSPTFFGEEMLMGSAFSPIPASAPATLQPNSAFPFQDMGVMPAAVSSTHQVVVPTPQQPVPTMAPLNVQTTDPMVTLAAQLHAITLANQRNNNINTNDALLRESLDLLSVCAPPSPPESLASSSSSSSDSISGTCGSPLEVSRSLRLPIFSKLSCSDDSD